MAQAIILNGAGGASSADSDLLTATEDTVLAGYTYVGADTDDEIGVGTLRFDGTASSSNVVKGYTFYKDSVNKMTGTLQLTGNAQQSDVYAGSTFYNTDPYDLKQGTMKFDGNAVASDVYVGKTFYKDSRDKLTGTMKFDGNATASQVLKDRTFYKDSRDKLTGTMPNIGSVKATLGINDSYTIAKGYHDGTGKITQNIPTMNAQYITPSANQQTISTKGKYLNGDIVVYGASNLARVVWFNYTVANKTKKFQFGTSASKIEKTQYLKYMDLDISQYNFRQIYNVMCLHSGTATGVYPSLDVCTWSYEGATEGGYISADLAAAQGLVSNTHLLLPIINIPNSKTTSMGIFGWIVGTSAV